MHITAVCSMYAWSVSFPRRSSCSTLRYHRYGCRTWCSTASTATFCLPFLATFMLALLSCPIDQERLPEAVLWMPCYVHGMPLQYSLLLLGCNGCSLGRLSFPVCIQQSSHILRAVDRPICAPQARSGCSPGKISSVSTLQTFTGKVDNHAPVLNTSQPYRSVCMTGPRPMPANRPITPQPR